MSPIAISPFGTARRQQGIILITALILVVMLTLVVLTSLSISLSSSSISKNVDSSLAARAAAQAAIETIINDPAFRNDPAAVAATPVNIDSNSDGIADYTVAMTATCTGARPVLETELDTLGNPDDQPCSVASSSKNSGIVLAAAGAVPGSSLCSDSRWTIRGVATRANSGDRADLSQGVSVRIPISKAMSFCNS